MSTQAPPAPPATTTPTEPPPVAPPPNFDAAEQPVGTPQVRRRRGIRFGIQSKLLVMLLATSILSALVDISERPTPMIVGLKIPAKSR